MQISWDVTCILHAFELLYSAYLSTVISFIYTINPIFFIALIFSYRHLLKTLSERHCFFVVKIIGIKQNRYDYSPKYYISSSPYQFLAISPQFNALYTTVVGVTFSNEIKLQSIQHTHILDVYSYVVALLNSINEWKS